MIKKISNFFSSNFEQNSLFLFLAVLVFSILRIPSVSEPYWYGDEGIYEVIGMALNHGRLLYQGIWDNKPPLLYLIYALFNGDQSLVRIFSLVFGIGSVIMIFLLAEKLFKKSISIFIATGFFAIMFGLPYLEGNIANAENFMLLPIITAFYLIIKSKKDNRVLFILSGLLFSLAFLTKIVAIFDLAAAFTYVKAMAFFDNIEFTKSYWLKEIKRLKVVLKEISLIGLAFIIPVVATALYFVSVGAFGDFFRATFSQNVGYVGYGNNFIFPMGLIFLKLFILVFVFFLTFRYRKHLGENGLFIFIWLSFALFSVFFPSRPYTHYLLMGLAPFSLFLGYIFENKKVMIVTIPVLIIILFLLNSNFSPYKKIVPYYSNYLSFMGGGSVDSYRAFFDKNTPRDYELANFIDLKIQPSDSVFLWTDSAQIYALSGHLPPGRYAVAYHITYYPDGISETQAALAKSNPVYIISTKDSPEIGEFLNNYELRYKIEGLDIYERKF